MTLALTLAAALFTGSIPTTKAAKAKWPEMAKITLAQAQEIALKAVPGTIDDAELELERGFLVYSIEIDDAAGTEHEVIVDAGDGKILAQLIDD